MYLLMMIKFSLDRILFIPERRKIIMIRDAIPLRWYFITKSAMLYIYINME